MKHQLFRAVALALLPIVLIGCSDPDIERVRTMSLSAGGGLFRGVPLSEVFEHSKVCTSPQWERIEDDYAQVVVQFTCSVETPDHVIDELRQQSMSKLAEAVSEKQQSYSERVNELTRRVEYEKQSIARVAQKEATEREEAERAIQNAEAFLASDTSRDLHISQRRPSEQSLAYMKQEYERRYSQNEEKRRSRSYAESSLADAQARIESLKGWEDRYRVALKETEAKVRNEVRERYAEAREFELRISFRVPSQQAVAFRSFEWTSDGKKVWARDAAPALWNPEDFDKSVANMRRQSVYFDARVAYLTQFPIECPRDSGSGGVTACEEQPTK